MVDKVKPLKFESSATGGTENDSVPTAADPAEDYLSAKGLSFEHSDNFLAEKIGDVLKFSCPDASQKSIYTGDQLDAVELFAGATQTTINRRVRVDLTYVSDNLTSEAWKIYDPADGTTVLRTITLTHTYTGGNYEKTTEATT